MERARAAILAETSPDALSRARWELARVVSTLEEAAAGAEGKRAELIAEAAHYLDSATACLEDAQNTGNRKRRGGRTWKATADGAVR